MTALPHRLPVAGCVQAPPDVPFALDGGPPVHFRLDGVVPLDERIDFTRASNDTVLNGDGVLATLGNNVPSFEFDANGVGQGLRTWPLLQNICLQSEALDTAPWSVGGSATITGNAGIAPSGSMTATELQAGVSGSPGDHSAFQSSILLATSTVHTSSIFVKNIDADVSRFIYRDVVGASDEAIAVITWSGPTISSVTAVGSADDVAAFEAWPDGWYRVWVTWTSDAVNTSYRVFVKPSVLTFGLSIYAFGSQCVPGSEPGPYIKTEGATASRAADLPIVGSAEVAKFFNPVEGTIRVRWTNGAIKPAGFPRVFEFDRIALGGERLSLIVRHTTGLVRLECQTGAVTQALVSGGTASLGEEMTAVCTYKENEFGISVNKAPLVLETSGLLPVGIDRLNIGHDSGGDPLNAHHKSFEYWPVAMPEHAQAMS